MPLKIVASFKRMRRFTNFAAIQNALETSALMEIRENKLYIRRKVPLALPKDNTQIKAVNDITLSRSVYAVSTI